VKRRLRVAVVQRVEVAVMAWVACRARVCGGSFAPLGQSGDWAWFDGLRDAQSSIASPVATLRRPAGARMVWGGWLGHDFS
jgi:hypothetical protein